MPAAGPKQRLGELLPALTRILGTFELPQLPQDAMDTDILAGGGWMMLDGWDVALQ